MLLSDSIAERIRQGLPGARVEVKDSTGTGDHFEATVLWDGFKGLSLVQQHQRVYATVNDWLKTGELHALALRTSA